MMYPWVCTNFQVDSLDSWTDICLVLLVLTLGLASGVTERLNVMWIPLYSSGSFWNVIEKRQWSWILGAVGCYYFATLGCVGIMDCSCFVEYSVHFFAYHQRIFQKYQPKYLK